MLVLKLFAKVAKDNSIDLYFTTKNCQQFRILREKLSDFRFTACDSERMPQNAQVVFEGTPEKTTEFFHFNDRQTEINVIYYYWIELLDGEQGGKCSHPITVTVRDRRVWWPREKVNAFMEGLAKDFPEKVTLTTCGHSTRGYPMRYISVGAAERKIAYVGTIHPGESGPETILPAIRRMLEEDKNAFDTIGVAMLPSVGMDAREDDINGVSHYLRTNPNGVDINRNFPAYWKDVSTMYGLSTDFYLDCVYRGPFPCSENETQAAMQFIANVKPLIVLSCHWLASVCENSFVFSSYADEEYTKRAREFALVYSRGFEKLLKRKYSEDEFYIGNICTGGSLPTYCYSLGIMAFDMEGGVNEEFSQAQIGCTDYDTLVLNSKCHENGLKSLMAYLA